MTPQQILPGQSGLYYKVIVGLCQRVEIKDRRKFDENWVRSILQPGNWVMILSNAKFDLSPKGKIPSLETFSKATMSQQALKPVFTLVVRD
jgi:hypothetical protein